MGQVIEQTLAPLGFDWKIGVGLIGAFAAREVFVSTMAVVYGLESADDEAGDLALRERLAAETRPDGTRLFTPLVCLSLMVFFVLRPRLPVHEHPRRRQARDRELPLARLPLHLHDRPRLARELPRLPGRTDLGL
jgi:Nucleoside recognition